MTDMGVKLWFVGNLFGDNFVVLLVSDGCGVMVAVVRCIGAFGCWSFRSRFVSYILVLEVCLCQ